MLVSILIPTFNAAPYIVETLESVLAQTYKKWECIIVDDHSTDSSVKIIERYCIQHPGKIFLFRNNGKGACAARNLAFEKSTGEYIQYLDADDLLSIDKIEKQVSFLNRSQKNIAVCNAWNFYKDIEIANNTDNEFLFSTNKPSDFLINLWGGNGSNHYIAVHSWLTPRTLIKKAGLWNEQLLKDQDGDFFARVVLSSEQIVFTPSLAAYYRKHYQSNNISAQKKREHIASNLKATQLKEAYLFAKVRTPKAKLALATQYKLVAIEAYPLFKDLYQQAVLNCKALGGSNYLPVMGGKSIEFIKKLFGWRAAKWISWFVHNKKIIRIFKKIIPVNDTA